MDNFFQTNSIWIKAQAEIKYLSLTWTWFNILIIFLILSLYALIFILSFMFKPKSNIKSCVCISLLGSQNLIVLFFFYYLKILLQIGVYPCPYKSFAIKRENGTITKVVYVCIYKSPFEKGFWRIRITFLMYKSFKNREFLEVILT